MPTGRRCCSWTVPPNDPPHLVLYLTLVLTRPGLSDPWIAILSSPAGSTKVSRVLVASPRFDLIFEAFSLISTTMSRPLLANGGCQQRRTCGHADRRHGNPWRDIQSGQDARAPGRVLRRCLSYGDIQSGRDARDPGGVLRRCLSCCDIQSGRDARDPGGRETEIGFQERCGLSTRDTSATSQKSAPAQPAVVSTMVPFPRVPELTGRPCHENKAQF